MADKKQHKWLDRHPILDEHDADWLERESAVHEFGEPGMPREEAESKAYANYTKRNSVEAAAHHLAGMRGTSGEEAKKHALHYALHCRALGADPSGPVPDEVREHMVSEDFKHPGKFRGHKADSLLNVGEDHEIHKSEIESRLETLYKAAKVAEILSKLTKP